MKKAWSNIILLISTAALISCANTSVLLSPLPGFPVLWLGCFLASAALPLLAQKARAGKQLWFLSYGNHCLKIFLAATVISIFIQGYLGFWVLQGQMKLFISNLVTCIAVLTLYFLLGILTVYCTSYQLGLKMRIWGICLGWVPLVNIGILIMIIHQTNIERKVEEEKELLNRSREAHAICQTKYPILLVHGVFFRDIKYFGYWGRIPEQLRRNGARVFYGNQPSAASVAQCARILANRIRQITEQTGCEKVNIIAHSKGGLDCRYAMAFYDADRYVASLTTINTPHRGSIFADYLLEKVSHKMQKRICDTYNKALRKLGEPEADLMSAARDLTTAACVTLDHDMPAPAGVLCRSVGSKMNRPSKGRFPMNFTGVMMQTISQDHDGLVSADSFEWGDQYIFLTTDSPTGISHQEMTDLNRTNRPDFDIREFYVQMVADLKKRGL